MRRLGQSAQREQAARFAGASSTGCGTSSRGASDSSPGMGRVQVCCGGRYHPGHELRVHCPRHGNNSVTCSACVEARAGRRRWSCCDHSTAAGHTGEEAWTTTTTGKATPTSRVRDHASGQKQRLDSRARASAATRANGAGDSESEADCDSRSGDRGCRTFTGCAPCPWAQASADIVGPSRCASTIP